ncbi:MAG: hypothetical protein V9E94_11645 [Microthrixaceae bacterium]
MALAPMPITADALGSKVVVVVPACRVEHRPHELLEAGDVGCVRAVQLAQARDDHVGTDPLTRRELERPRQVLAVPRGGDDLDAEPQVRPEIVAVDQRLEVLEDLGLFGELAGPVGLGGEREAVQVRRDVTCSTRVGVISPCTPHAVGLLVDRVGVDPGIPELHRHAQPSGPSSEDRDAGRRSARHHMTPTVRHSTTPRT